MADLTVNHLRRDHQQAREALNQLVSLLDELEKDPRWTPERCADFGGICKFLTCGLDLLVRKQDEVLYPALAGLFPNQDGPLSVLRGEHQALSRHFREVCRAGKALCKGEDAEKNLHILCKDGRIAAEILGDHLYKEERVLFPMVTRFLTPERDAELLNRMESIASGDSAKAVSGGGIS